MLSFLGNRAILRRRQGETGAARAAIFRPAPNTA